MFVQAIVQLVRHEKIGSVDIRDSVEETAVAFVAARSYAGRIA